MIDDPIIEELHRVREELAAKFNYDLHGMFAHWRVRQAEEGRQVVSFAAKEPQPKEPMDEIEAQDLAA